MEKVCMKYVIYEDQHFIHGGGPGWGMGGGGVPPPSISIIPLKYDSLMLKTHLISL